MVARVTRRDVRTVPITLRNRACVWKCVCRAILISDRQFALHICFSARVTRPRVILETATPLFLQKMDRILWIQKRLDEIDRENNQLRIKFVVNNWNNIVDNNIRYRFVPACRKRIEYFISRFFLLFLFIDTSNCLFLWTEKNSFRKKTKKILFGGESRIVKKRWGARWGARMIAWFRQGLEGVTERGGRVVKGDAGFVGGRIRFTRTSSLASLSDRYNSSTGAFPMKHASTHLTR